MLSVARFNSTFWMCKAFENLHKGLRKHSKASSIEQSHSEFSSTEVRKEVVEHDDILMCAHIIMNVYFISIDDWNGRNAKMFVLLVCLLLLLPPQHVDQNHLFSIHTMSAIDITHSTIENSGNSKLQKDIDEYK